MIFTLIVLCAAVECKKPWHYLACTLYLNGKNETNYQVRLFLAEGNSSLQFTKHDYKDRFGNEKGENLFYALKRILAQFPRITAEQIKTKISIRIWKVFSEKWVKIFKCTKASRDVCIERGGLYLFFSFFIQKGSVWVLVVHQSKLWSLARILKLGLGSLQK